jgi:hypothetical protein
MLVIGALLLGACTASAAGIGSDSDSSGEVIAIVGRTKAYETRTVISGQTEEFTWGVYTFEIYGRPSGAPLLSFDGMDAHHPTIRFFTRSAYVARPDAPPGDRPDPDYSCPSPVPGDQLYLVFVKRAKLEGRSASDPAYIAVACTKIDDKGSFGFVRDY